MGARPREWDGRWAELAAAGPRRPADRGQVAGCLLAYARALDGDEPSRAAAPLARAFSARCLLPPDARAALDLETAFFVARFRGRGALAGRLLDLTRSRRVRLADLERARAAVHLAAGRLSEAEAACDRALAALETAGPRPSGLVVLDRELLGAMRDEARSRPAAQPGQILPGRLVPAGQGGTPSRSAGPEPGAGDAGSGRIG